MEPPIKQLKNKLNNMSDAVLKLTFSKSKRTKFPSNKLYDKKKTLNNKQNSSTA